jgi:hypothetical protein
MKNLPQGLKPLCLYGFYGTAEQGAEKGLALGGVHEMHPAGAEARDDLAALTA